MPPHFKENMEAGLLASDVKNGIVAQCIPLGE